MNGDINFDNNNFITFQLKYKTCLNDYIGKLITPLRIRMTNHRFVILSHVKKTISSKAI